MAHTHFNPEELNDRYEFKGPLRSIAFGLIGVGIVLLLVGAFLGGSPSSTEEDHGADSHSSLEQVDDQSATFIRVQNDEHGDEHADEHGDEGHGETHGEDHADETHAEGDSHGEEHDSEGHLFKEGDSHGDGEHHDGDHAEHSEGHGHHAPVHPISMRTRVLANILLAGMYFFLIGCGALFFLAIHKVANGGWQTAIRRIPEAMTQYIAIGGVLFLVLLAFLPQLFDWAYIESNDLWAQDALVNKKKGWLNTPFFAIRTVLFIGFWVLTATLIRRWSVASDIDKANALSYFKKEGTLSAVFIIIYAITFCLFTFDWLKSLEPHFFSTIYGVKMFGRSMVSAMVVMYFITAYLRRQGHLKHVSNSHMHDIGGYAFGFTIFWSYVWLAQYLLIWYSNIPEEGMYYVKRYRMDDPNGTYLGYAFFFYGNIIINFIIPFLGLIAPVVKRNIQYFLPIGIVMLYGHWHDLYNLIMPGAMRDQWGIGLVEIGAFLAFAGLFIFVVFTALSRANLYAKHHPYMEESYHHNTGEIFKDIDLDPAK
ncbi:MAG: hypothetical protein MRZ79_10930 [Bacteroidia bacterium]|nr:hypothetical protein [Bacteroidia bacterium]